MEKETLEEAVKNYSEKEYSTPKPLAICIDFAKFGAKWQAERMYSEEELKSLLIKALTHNDYDLCGSLSTKDWEIRTANFEVWFEHNKK